MDQAELQLTENVYHSAGGMRRLNGVPPQECYDIARNMRKCERIYAGVHVCVCMRV